MFNTLKNTKPKLHLCLILLKQLLWMLIDYLKESTIVQDIKESLMNKFRNKKKIRSDPLSLFLDDFSDIYYKWNYENLKDFGETKNFQDLMTIRNFCNYQGGGCNGNQMYYGCLYIEWPMLTIFQ
ncbi:hypothetical protein pb186bvf_020658 [Paramecium bursaria]